MAAKPSIVPKQRIGGYSNNTVSLSLKSVSAAANHFKIVKKRLMDINGWGAISNHLASFQLTDTMGLPKSGIPEEGDHIKIDVPGPGTKTSGQFEWVKIEYIVKHKNTLSDSESVAILVRPSENPFNKMQGIAHFFSDNATSTFIVGRDKNTITAKVYGRNETPNTFVSSIKDKIRNIFLGIGAILGFSKIQWKSLINGLVRMEA